MSWKELRRSVFLRVLRWRIIQRYWLNILATGATTYLRSKDQAIDSSFTSWVLSILLALAPWGTSMLDAHPCFAWVCWLLALCSALYALKKGARLSNWIKLLIIVSTLVAFGWFGKRSLDDHTELSFPFV